MLHDQRYVIEVDGKSAGLVVRDRNGFKFYAAAPAFSRLEGLRFRSPGHAEDVCRAAARAGKNAGFSCPPSNLWPQWLSRTLGHHQPLRRDRAWTGPRHLRPGDATDAPAPDVFVPESGLPNGWPYGWPFNAF